MNEHLTQQFIQFKPYNALIMCFFSFLVPTQPTAGDSMLQTINNDNKAEDHGHAADARDLILDRAKHNTNTTTMVVQTSSDPCHLAIETSKGGVYEKSSKSTCIQSDLQEGINAAFVDANVINLQSLQNGNDYKKADNQSTTQFASTLSAAQQVTNHTSDFSANTQTCNASTNNASQVSDHTITASLAPINESEILLNANDTMRITNAFHVPTTFSAPSLNVIRASSGQQAISVPIVVPIVPVHVPAFPVTAIAPLQTIPTTHTVHIPNINIINTQNQFNPLSLPPNNNANWHGFNVAQTPSATHIVRSNDPTHITSYSSSDSLYLLLMCSYKSRLIHNIIITPCININK